MDKRLHLRHHAQSRGVSVCVEHRSAFEATPGGQKTLAKLTAYPSTVDGQFADLQRYLDNREAATGDCRTGRQLVREGIAALANIAPVVELEESAAKAVRLPRTGSDDELLSVAREVVDKVMPYRADFEAQGLPSGVLADLPKQIAALAAAKDVQSKARRDYTITTRSIRRALDANADTLRVAETILAHSPEAKAADAVTKLRIAKRIGPAASSDQAAVRPSTEPTTAPSGTPKVA